MPYNVTFDIADSKSNILGCNALLDEFTTAEFGTGTLTDVEAGENIIILDVQLGTANTTKVKFVIDNTQGGPLHSNVAVAEFELKDTIGGSDLCSGGTATSRSNIGSSYTADKAVDDNNGTMWNESFIAGSSWWAYEFASAEDVVQYTIRARTGFLSNSPTEWTIYVWVNGDWVEVGTESTTGDWSGGEQRTFTFPQGTSYKSSGNRVSTATDVGSYGATGPDLKIKWAGTLPVGTSITIETGTSDSDSTPPATWYEQTNGASVTNLPADLTGKYLYYKASLTTIDNTTTPELKWLVIYDGADAPTAAARVEFNSEIKAVPSTGTVTFTGVEPGTDLPYTIYALTLDGVDKFENIHPAGFADTVTVVDADVTETVSIVIPNAVVTQQYLEVAVQLQTPPNAFVTQQYIEVGYVDGGSTPVEPTPGDFKLYLGTTPVNAIYLGTQNITDVILGG